MPCCARENSRSLFALREESRQALDRGCGRQKLRWCWAACSGRGRGRSHDQRPRPGTYGRHARQAGGNSGFDVNLPVAQFRRVLESCGCAMIGQTAEIAPAIASLRAARCDGTVESPYLICASIMSKKLAEGIDALVLDVKTGSGAFMKTEEEAAFLAELMVETGERMGKQVVALITDMDQPLGCTIGNALEVVEVVDVLRGGGPEICASSAWGLRVGCSISVESPLRLRKEKTKREIDFFRESARQARQMVELQGGDPRVIDDPQNCRRLNAR